MVRDSFVFYRSWYESVKALEEQEDVFCEVMRTILEYGLYGKTPRKLSPMATAFFTMIKPQIDANTKRYLNGLKGKEFGKLGAEFGKLGGRPKKNTEDPKNDIDYKSIDYQQDNCKKITPQDIKNNPPNNPPNVYVNDNVNVNVNEYVNGNNLTESKDSVCPTAKKQSDDIDSKAKSEIIKKGFEESALCEEMRKFYNQQVDINQSRLPKVTCKLANNRKQFLLSRIKEYGEQIVKQVITTATMSDFLGGDNNSGFRASFEWIMRPNNFPKVLDGNYNNNSKTNKNGTNNPNTQRTAFTRETLESVVDTGFALYQASRKSE